MTRRRSYPKLTAVLVRLLAATLLLAATVGPSLRQGSARRGGPRPIGEGIPAVPHDDLDALLFSAWQREKDKYVCQGWGQKRESAASATMIMLFPQIDGDGEAVSDDPKGAV